MMIGSKTSSKVLKRLFIKIKDFIIENTQEEITIMIISVNILFIFFINVRFNFQ